MSLFGNGRTSPAPKVGEAEALYLTRAVLGKLTEKSPLQNINVRLWNGELWPNAGPKPATLVLRDSTSLRTLLSARTEVQVGEAYLENVFEVEGDMEAAFELSDLLARQTLGWKAMLSLGGLRRRLPGARGTGELARQRHARLRGAKGTPKRNREAVGFHYDVSNEFYALWLDERMVYSCAYFEDEATSLDAAQERKLDLVCRKLGLKAGERLLEIGCGWGGLLIHAAKRYGVRAEGITLSEKQLEWTRLLIAREGLTGQVSVRLADYRELGAGETYDKIASIGMVEHVARAALPGYFAEMRRLLKPGGLFLNHGIGLGPLEHINQNETFIENYVFPDAELISIHAMLRAAEEQRWEVRDVESLRHHYALTLRHWVRRLEAHHAEAVREIDETRYRIWRLYMAGSAYSFQHGYLNVYQTLLAKLGPGGATQASFTRENWYLPKN